ncbi:MULTISPECIES: hypothetical protein [Staphylococcus intermedius group]|uniref:Uncharacterized protein n=1 Tax=Staphylococcus intermedius NCTC 11048 TaxID=1141106 RepID=A0A380G6E5_STAIN|nr:MULTISPECIES: hypothetical protein [Staphylococcus intermedius group]SUM46332.1 Uncharacterised protein [Staphylococcus intermedius NCTC 11048]
MNELQEVKEETIISLLKKIQQANDPDTIIDLTRSIETILEIK